MLEKIYISKASSLFAENRLLKFAVLVVGLTTLINTVQISRAMKHQKVVIVPAGICGEQLIEGDNLPEDYMRQMVRYITGLALNFTPLTARGQFDELLRLYSPDSFIDAKKLFYDLASAVEVSKNTTTFFIQKITVDKKRGRIEITGLRRQFVDNTRLTEMVKTYFIDFQVVSGRFQVMRFSEKTDSQG